MPIVAALGATLINTTMYTMIYSKTDKLRQ